MQLGKEVQVLRNDQLNLTNMLWEGVEGIVLSPGPGEPRQAGMMMDLVDLMVNRIPIFGVCLGMQALGLHFGGKLQRAVYPMHGKVSEIEFTKHPMFENITAPMEVCRYHSLVLDQIEETELDIVAKSDIGEIMAIAHPKLAVWGVQFHPEAILTPYGKQILANWIKRINLHR